MAPNLHVRRLGSALVALLAAGPGAPDRPPCPPLAGELVAQGWAAYRSDSLAAAARLFARSDSLCPDRNLDAKVGLGFTALRQDRLARADSLFQLVARASPDNGDAWEGLTLVAWRRGDRAGALDAARRAIRLDPDNATTRRILAELDPDWDRPGKPDRVRQPELRVDARARGDVFEVPDSTGWRRFYIKGLNLGVALPGRFPAEFPTDSLVYAGWLDTIAGMGANTVRVYTILPPAFYRALRGWNRTHPDRILRLLHGVWTELPPDHDFDQPDWKAEFRAEMRRVVDLIHGAARLPPRPGHASGRYDADVSPWTLGYIIGREWEPYAVLEYDRRAGAARAPYRGQFLEAEAAPAADRWMAEQCDYLLAYEVDRYNTLRPIAYTNWPTLDPLHHETESTVAEELAIRARLGRPISGRPPLEYDNDAIGLDAMLIRPTAANPAGWFASFHAYPYYPDFMLYEPAYDSAHSSLGRSNYFGYLRALKRHHAGIPLVIAEYGVPSSRGLAHWQPQGWHHGGHDEHAMAQIDARLTREIRESGAAGGILFAWLDEWFKRNWAVMDYEIPPENNRLWHNVMDPEQHYGVLGLYAGDAGTSPVLGGDPSRWRALRRLAPGSTKEARVPSPATGESRGGDGRGPTRRLGALRAGNDEAYVYLAVELPRWDPDATDLLLALDTYRADLGQRALPGRVLTSEAGFEFLAVFRDTSDAELRVTPDYNPYAGAEAMVEGDNFSRFARRPVTTVPRDDGRFDSLFVFTNRTRYTRDGRVIPARGYNRGRLRFGAAAASTLADWYYDRTAGLLEVRLAWGLLNVSDPSSATVLFEAEAASDRIGTAASDGFRIGLVLLGPDGRVADALPEPGPGGRWLARDLPAWRWAPWTEPRWHQRLKPVYDTLRATWGSW
jgi:hypothetical protein